MVPNYLKVVLLKTDYKKGPIKAGFSTIMRCLRSLQSLTNKHQIYISKRQLSDVSDVLRQLRHHLKILVCQGPITLHMDI